MLSPGIGATETSLNGAAVSFGKVLFVAAAYVATAKLGLHFATIHGNVTPIWPPAGIGMAALVLMGWRVWPGVFLGAFLANLWTDVSVVTAGAIAIGNTLEGILGAAMIRRAVGASTRLEDVREIMAFVVIGLAASTVAATGGAIALASSGSAEWAAFGSIWVIWWLGDATGVIVVAPFVIAWFGKSRPITRDMAVEGLAVLTLAFLLAQFVFCGWFGTWQINYPLAFTPFAVLVWASLRLGRRGAVTANLLMCVVATIGTADGFGPFAIADTHESFLMLQMFMAICAVTSLSLAATVTRRRTAEDDLRRSNEDLRKLSHAVEQSSNMVFITDFDGKIEYVNPKFTEMTGYAPEEAVSQLPSLIKSGDTPREIYEDLWSTVLSGNSWRGELKDRRKDGKAFWASVSIFPVRDDDDVITHFVAMHEDITHRKLAEEKIRAAMEHAEVANRAKSELLANMSHELRTPLNAIIGFSNTIKQEVFGPLENVKYREYAGDILDSGEHLLNLINDILDVSAIEAGKVDLLEEEVSIQGAVEASLRLIQHRAERGGVALRNELPKDSPGLWADERRIKQVLINLLSNAVKFTPQGGHVTVTAYPADGGGYSLVVIDTGIGMDENGIAKAMSQFGQVDSSLNRKFEGTGLGLPLAKGLVDLHGGRFEIESRAGEGTIVCITFPVERVLAG